MGTIRRGTPAGAVLACAMLLAGCGSDPVAVEDDPLEVADLFGTWSWVSSQGGIMGETRTPESEGFEQTLEIEEPNQIALFQDGELVASTTFQFEAADPRQDETLSELTYAEPLLSSDTQFVGIDLDGSLVLADPCCDGFVHTFSPGDGQ